MKTKRILITGPLGHIGSKFIHNIKPGDFEEVILIDNLSTQRYCSLFKLPQGVPFHFIEADILEEDIESLCKGVDVVLHLAAITDAANSFENAGQVERMNYGGTEKVAKACAANNCRLIFISTTSVYGTQCELVDENCGAEDLKP
ncbi:MAG: NAD-dependent epimerase/dehydratase family protein, partial [Nitrospirota bacterium]|nr:NAD-dependent epimerase/dehydratase family protein [Nitrospirota bacterium]